MAGQEISEVFCWQFRVDALNIRVGSTGEGALRVGISLEETGDCEAYFRDLFPSAEVRLEYGPNRPLIRAVEEVLQGESMPESLDLHLRGTPFQIRAWKTIAGIAFGETRTYGEVAQRMGCPGGARAVGQAMNRNPLPLLFP